MIKEEDAISKSKSITVSEVKVFVTSDNSPNFDLFVKSIIDCEFNNKLQRKGGR